VILVPVKNTSSAKQRLADILDQPSRTALAQAMLHDVLTTLHNWKARPPVAVVTSDPYAVKLASEYAFEVIPDPDNPGETGAIEIATRICVERGAGFTLVIPADIPLIEAWELEEILKQAPAEALHRTKFRRNRRRCRQPRRPATTRSTTRRNPCAAPASRICPNRLSPCGDGRPARPAAKRRFLKTRKLPTDIIAL
jgi:hypothetical protein